MPKRSPKNVGRVATRHPQDDKNKGKSLFAKTVRQTTRTRKKFIRQNRPAKKSQQTFTYRITSPKIRPSDPDGGRTRNKCASVAAMSTTSAYLVIAPGLIQREPMIIKGTLVS